jgi:hypothetical protein
MDLTATSVQPADRRGPWPRFSEHHDPRHRRRADRHIELDGDSHGPKGRELLENLVANSPDRGERALRAACISIKSRIGLWNGTLNKLRDSRRIERSVEAYAAD